MKRILALLIVSLTAIAANAQNGCKADYTGKVYCAPPGGYAVESISGIVCAPGRCIANNQGYLKCSKELGGGASTDNQGNVFCAGGCVNPSPKYCVEAKGEEEK